MFFVFDDYDVFFSLVYCFYSIYIGMYFYIIDIEEMYFVWINYVEYFNFEGVVWWVIIYVGLGWVLMYWFFNILMFIYFYMNSEDECLRVIEMVFFMEYEGIGYYVCVNGS